MLLFCYTTLINIRPLVVIIFDKIIYTAMKPKRKAPTVIKKGSKKLTAAKPIMLFDKTIATTK
jgi:hypothetical protein